MTEIRADAVLGGLGNSKYHQTIPHQYFHLLLLGLDCPNDVENGEAPKPAFGIVTGKGNVQDFLHVLI